MAVKESKIKFSISKNKAGAIASGADESTIYFANTYDESTGKPTNPAGIVVGGQVFAEPHYEVVSSSETISVTTDSQSREVNLSVEKVPNKLKIKTSSTGYTEYDGSEQKTVDTVYAATTATTAGSATKATQDASGNVITSTYATKTELNNLGSTVQGLAGALKFAGTADTSGDTTFTDGMTTMPVTVEGVSKTLSTGNVVIQGNNEYAWTGSKWVLLGIPTVGVTATQTSGTKIATVTANGKNTDLYVPSSPSSLKNPNALTVQGHGTTSFTYDGSEAKTLNIKKGTGISVSSDTSGNITIDHSNSVTKGTAGTSSATSGASIDIPYVTYDAQGHITATGTHKHNVDKIASTKDTTHALISNTDGTSQWVGLIPSSAINEGTDANVASGGAVKSAYNKATAAATAAETAQSTANSANSTANSAMSTANSALTEADNALTYLTWQ